jgi:hypothetical protein
MHYFYLQVIQKLWVLFGDSLSKEYLSMDLNFYYKINFELSFDVLNSELMNNFE